MTIMMIILFVLTYKLSNEKMYPINLFFVLSSGILSFIYVFNRDKFFKNKHSVNPYAHEDENYIPPVKENLTRKDFFEEDKKD